MWRHVSAGLRRERRCRGPQAGARLGRAPRQHALADRGMPSTPPCTAGEQYFLATPGTTRRDGYCAGGWSERAVLGTQPLHTLRHRHSTYGAAAAAGLVPLPCAWPCPATGRAARRPLTHPRLRARLHLAEAALQSAALLRGQWIPQYWFRQAILGGKAFFTGTALMPVLEETAVASTWRQAAAAGGPERCWRCLSAAGRCGVLPACLC